MYLKLTQCDMSDLNKTSGGNQVIFSCLRTLGSFIGVGVEGGGGIWMNILCFFTAFERL